MSKKATELVQFKLRIREGLRRQIEREAKKNGRSVNAEAVERLEQSFAQQQTADIIKATARNAAVDVFEFLLKNFKETEVSFDSLLKQLKPEKSEVLGGSDKIVEKKNEATGAPDQPN